MATGAVRVRGLRELTRAFKKISKDLDKELTNELKEAAEPVRSGAEKLALGRIRNMPRSPHYAGMRVGVSKAQGAVYVVPAWRRRGGSGRANLKTLLLERAMDPALEENQGEVLDKVDRMLGRLAGHQGF
jgi:hypothetical protein